MSAEDNSSAEPADIGEALVTALGFEPAEGRKRTRRSGATTADESSDEMFAAVAADSAGTDGAVVEDLDKMAAGTVDSNTESSGTNGTSGDVGAVAAGAAAGSASSSATSTQNRSGGSRKSKKRRNRNNSAGAGPGVSKSSDARDSANGPSSGGAGPAARDDIKSAAKPIVSTNLKPKPGSPITAADGTMILPGSTDDSVAPPGSTNGSGSATAAQLAAETPLFVDSAPTTNSTAADTDTAADGSSPETAGRHSSTRSGSSSDKVGGARGAGSDSAAADTAAVTGELLDIIDAAEDQPPPPSAADAIQVLPTEESQESQGGTEALSTVPTSPPTMPGGAPPAEVATGAGTGAAAAASTATSVAADADATQKIEAKLDPTTADALPSTADARPATADARHATADALPARADTIPTTPATSRQALELRADERLDPTTQFEAATARPAPGFEISSLPNIFRRKRRVQARKVRRVIRHIDPWSVLTFSVLFHLCVFAALLLASVLVWNAADAAGTIENMEAFILELGDYETFEIKGDVVFRAAVAIAGILTLASSVLLVLLTVVFNLISDLVGGIRLTVIEEETVRVRRKKKA